ncbi:MAG: hypothetical protein BGP24_15015 [Lysobacterales bacterium 69-70]|nr:hypothetical protein [Xanthomonadaceae bacterium]ODU35392.1 MAG: hypothetical protein ABS97_05840 [Xanthomonadaceae bacterium SCN 69-320]ODV16843.1 MAG: hypothetical protein ABT27_18875 [Xanthomonadaceae bacterium SCN 69-25]OJY94287.1 MAG: hypothetical protein BGP24_15015 [Xanthomonadales bacterium 69-70]
MARKRLVPYQELQELLQARYIEGTCTMKERITVEIMRFDDSHFDLDCLLKLAGKNQRAKDGGKPE